MFGQLWKFNKAKAPGNVRLASFGMDIRNIRAAFWLGLLRTAVQLKLGTPIPEAGWPVRMLWTADRPSEVSDWPKLWMLGLKLRCSRSQPASDRFQKHWGAVKGPSEDSDSLPNASDRMVEVSDSPKLRTTGHRSLKHQIACLVAHCYPADRK